ncbi:hypothetical protein ONS95_013100 [Cadophora gregata]|uniref:uncharacterized protein n=1 Tax=Cadophora gregata TaxID=51156 RepID=UPI0026DB3FCE|nr:uncharacterized protein ONS95_013100 [Cadophora gregata]KAK0100088.1 hypothetical protein ONS96_008023 [Cadophora gregata f. sp. sojae]KAK0116068.1 hypothetical protein ONS95_013100 [Cadophora gregata]
MVSTKDIRKSNAAFKSSDQASGLVAVFVGATSGIGMGSLKQFAKNAKAPKIYILGRSSRAATPLLDEIKASNPEGSYEFIETEISLIKNVDKACDEIKSKEKKVDLVFTSPGYLAFGGRLESEEGIDIPHALRYYSRLRFIYNLLPLLKASPLPRVISILAGGQEAAIDVHDLEVKNNFTFIKAAENGTTQTTLAFEELAKSNPTITFIHKYPGFVNSGVLDRLLASASGLYTIPATVGRWLILPVVNLFSMTVDEAGERVLFLATSSRYPASKTASSAGVPLQPGMKVAEASVENDGISNGVYRLGPNDESAKESPVLPGYRSDGVDTLVWESTQAVWEKALARST